MYCKNCGKLISNNENFCRNCGHSTKQTENIVNQISSKKNKKKNYFTFVIICILIIITITLITNEFGFNNGTKEKNKVAESLSENINNNCKNYVSYINHNKNSTDSWNVKVDIGVCDGKFVKNTFNEKKGDKPTYMDKYNYSISEYPINNHSKINSLFDKILYYEPSRITSTQVILPGSSVNSIDNYTEQLREMGKILYEESTYEYNDYYPVTFNICFTESDFVSNNYYKAFLVEDMERITTLPSSYRSINNTEMLNINECVSLLILFKSLNFGHDIGSIEYVKNHPIVFEG